MATIQRYDTANGVRWRVRYRTPDNKQTDKRGFTRKRDAEIWLSNVEIAKTKSEYVSPSAGRVTIAELAAPWLAGKKTALKPSSYNSLDIAWRIHVEPKWGARTIASIGTAEVREWINSFDKSASVVHRAVAVLSGILDTAVENRQIGRNVVHGSPMPRKRLAKEVRRYLAWPKLEQFATACGDNRTLILTLGLTGIRWSEAVALTVSDIDFRRHRISVRRAAIETATVIHVGPPKSHRARTVPIPALLERELFAICEKKTHDALVFPGPDGGFMKRIRVSKTSHSWFCAARTAASIPDDLVLHDLRHTAASLAISAGANVKAVQRMLGHASAAVTLDIYADLFDDDLDLVRHRIDAMITNNCGQNVGTGMGSEELNAATSPEIQGSSGEKTAGYAVEMGGIEAPVQTLKIPANSTIVLLPSGVGGLRLVTDDHAE